MVAIEASAPICANVYYCQFCGDSTANGTSYDLYAIEKMDLVSVAEYQIRALTYSPDHFSKVFSNKFNLLIGPKYEYVDLLELEQLNSSNSAAMKNVDINLYLRDNSTVAIMLCGDVEWRLDVYVNYIVRNCISI
jgi:hypothetical protein